MNYLTEAEVWQRVKESGALDGKDYILESELKQHVQLGSGSEMHYVIKGQSPASYTFCYGTDEVRCWIRNEARRIT